MNSHEMKESELLLLVFLFCFISLYFEGLYQNMASNAFFKCAYEYSRTMRINKVEKNIERN